MTAEPQKCFGKVSPNFFVKELIKKVNAPFYDIWRNENQRNILKYQMKNLNIKYKF